MDLLKKDSSFYLNENSGQESKQLVLMTYGYDKEKVNGRKIVNGNFEILEKLGEGSFWTVYKVERSVMNESINNKSFHVFKEGILSFINPEDKIVEENQNPEENHNELSMKKNDENGKSFENERESNSDNLYSQNINDIDFPYSDEILKNGMDNLNFKNLSKIEFIKILKDQRVALKELYLLRKINHKNIARLYECIIDESIDKIVFVMEYCDLGQLMKYNFDETGYEYNKKLILFLLRKLFLENLYNQRNIIFELLNFKKDKDLILSEKILIEKFNGFEDEINEENENERYIFDLFEQNFKLKIYFCKIFLKQIIEAVRYLHSKNICNRDVKPENIVFKNTFVLENFEESDTYSFSETKINDQFVKITDFSIGKIFENKDVKIINFAGSDLFKAPEMLNFEYFNPFKAEIYSIGVTMIYFLFKKFYKSKSIKDWNDEERNKIFEDLITNDEFKNEIGRNNSKLLMMKSNSFLSRPRKSSIIYNNFEKSLNKECINNFEETKYLFDYFEETDFYDFLKSFIEDNPDQRIDIETCSLDF